MGRWVDNGCVRCRVWIHRCAMSARGACRPRLAHLDTWSNGQAQAADAATLGIRNKAGLDSARPMRGMEWWHGALVLSLLTFIGTP